MNSFIGEEDISGDTVMVQEQHAENTMDGNVSKEDGFFTTHNQERGTGEFDTHRKY